LILIDSIIASMQRCSSVDFSLALLEGTKRPWRSLWRTCRRFWCGEQQHYDEFFQLSTGYKKDWHKQLSLAPFMH